MLDLMNEKLKVVASLLDEIQTISGVVNGEDSNLYGRIYNLRCDLEDIKEDNECVENVFSEKRNTTTFSDNQR